MADRDMDALNLNEPEEASPRDLASFCGLEAGKCVRNGSADSARYYARWAAHYGFEALLKEERDNYHGL